MRLLNAYVLRQLAVVTLVVAVTLTCAIWLTQSLRFIELIVNRGLTLATFFNLTLLLLPSFLWLLLPIALFAAVLFTYQRLSADSELTVMRAFGRSPLQIARPALALSVIVAAIGFASTDVSVLASSSSTHENMKQTKAATPMPAAIVGMKMRMKNLQNG